jgi:hypothetical protein
MTQAAVVINLYNPQRHRAHRTSSSDAPSWRRVTAIKSSPRALSRSAVPYRRDSSRCCALHPKFIDHLQKMFLAFRDTSCLVIPSLIDFKAFGANVLLTPAVAAAPPIEFAGSVIIQGTKASPAVDNGCFDRQAIVQDSAIRDVFFRQTLEAFLTASIPFKTSIYAWEVQNEPYWNIQSFLNGFTPLRFSGGPTVTESESSVFLQQGIDLIHKHGFQSTVGHRFADDLDNLPTGSRRQFHYYPFALGSLPIVGQLIGQM